MLNQLLTALILSSSLFTATAQAAKVVPHFEVSCRPTLAASPYDSFLVKVDGKIVTLETLEGKDAARWSTEEKAIEQKLSVQNTNIQDMGDGLEILRLTLSFEFGWGSAEIDLRKDDNGNAAFVQFESDGPSMLSFYRCTTK